MTVTINGTTGIVNNATDLNYTGTLTGGTGVVNLGSGQFYKDASGNVGIGTSSPGYKLDVSGVVRASGSFLSGSDLQINPSGYNLYLRNLSGINRIDSYNSPITATVPLNINSSLLTFAIADTERARIDSSGVAMFNTTTQLIRGGETFRVNGGTGIASFASNVNGPVIAIKNNYAVSTYQIAFNNNTQECGTITTGSNTVGYNSNSDYRLKENIQPMVGALAKVALLKPVTYQWKADGSDGQGFIAHELQEVVPEAVTGEKDGVDDEGNPRYQGIDTSFLVATLTAAIQELNAKVDAQAAEIAALKGQL